MAARDYSQQDGVTPDVRPQTTEQDPRRHAARPLVRKGLSLIAAPVQPRTRASARYVGATRDDATANGRGCPTTHLVTGYDSWRLGVLAEAERVFREPYTVAPTHTGLHTVASDSLHSPYAVEMPRGRITRPDSVSALLLGWVIAADRCRSHGPQAGSIAGPIVETALGSIPARY